MASKSKVDKRTLTQIRSFLGKPLTRATPSEIKKVFKPCVAGSGLTKCALYERARLIRNRRK